MGAETTQGTICAEWFRRRREGRRRFRQHDDDSISETDLRNESYTVFTADVKKVFLNAHMKDGDMVYARPPPQWQRETLDPSKGRVIWKLQKSHHGLRSARRRWQDHLEEILRNCGFVPNMLDTCLWTHDEASITRIPRGRLVVGWNAPDHQGNPHLIEPRPGAQEQRGDNATSALLGTNLVKKNEAGYNFGIDASHVESTLEEFNMSALKSTNTALGTLGER